VHRYGETRWDRLWAELITRERGRGLSDEQVTECLAVEMYRSALACGAGDADIGLFGPTLFLRDARRVVAESNGYAPEAARERAPQPEAAMSACALSVGPAR
jgi:hypothetical protein